MDLSVFSFTDFKFLNLARGFTTCLKTYPENLTATCTSTGFKNACPKIF